MERRREIEPASYYSGPPPGLSDRLLNRVGRQFQSAENAIPKAMLRKAANVSITLGLRRDSSRGRVWRPLIESALGEDLVVDIDASKVTGWLGQFVSVPNGTPFDAKPWFLLPGKWDLCPLAFDRHPTYRRMRDVVAFKDYRESPSYREVKSQQAAGTLPKRLARAMGEIGSVEEYFEHYRDFAKLIKRVGAVPNFGAYDSDRYVGLVIGRNGQVLQFQKGHHRMALAHLLKCRRVLAKVLAVHSCWAEDVVKSSRLEPTKAITKRIAQLGT